MEYGFIYETTNLSNGKKYIGKHKRYQNPTDPDDSWYLGSGTHLQSAINKYGRSNFSRKILCNCKDEEELRSKEKYYIDLYNAVDSDEYYNLCRDADPPVNIKKGKDHPCYGKHLTEEHRRKISESSRGHKKSEETKRKMSLNHADMRGEKSPMYGRIVSEETRRKMSEANSNPTEELRQKRSLAVIGDKNPMYGKHHTDDTKIKMSLAQIGEKNHFYGKKHSEETKRKISESTKGIKKVCHRVCIVCGTSFISACTNAKYCESCR